MKQVLTLAGVAILASHIAYAEGQLNIYNWSDYIAEDTIANFEAETGISVTYDVYDSNEVLEAKMMDTATPRTVTGTIPGVPGVKRAKTKRQR